MDLTVLSDRKLSVQYDGDKSIAQLTDAFVKIGCSDVQHINEQSFVEAYTSIEPNTYLFHIDTVDGGVICTVIIKQEHLKTPFILDLLKRAFSFTIHHGHNDA